jgi:hypothetical protein
MLDQPRRQHRPGRIFDQRAPAIDGTSVIRST